MHRSRAMSEARFAYYNSKSPLAVLSEQSRVLGARALKVYADESELPVQIDADGYLAQLVLLWDEVTAAETAEIYYTEDATLDALVERYYVLLRPMVSFCGEVFHRDIGQEVIGIWRLALWVSACRFTAIHLRFAQPVAPQWTREFDAEVRSALTARAPIVNDVCLAVTLAPELSARAITDRKIAISAFTRELFKEFSTAMWNCLLRIGDAAERHGVSAFRDTKYRRPVLQQLARAIVPYLIFLNQYVSWGRMPVTFAATQQIARCALATSELQTKFILAHEYGHVVLDHVSQTRCDNATPKEREEQANTFGLEWAFDPAGHEHAGDAWTALQWLLMFQYLDQLVASLLCGDTLAQPPSSYGTLQTLARHRPSDLGEDAGYATVGASFLYELGERLVSGGSLWLRSLSSTLAIPPNEGPVPNWWLEL